MTRRFLLYFLAFFYVQSLLAQPGPQFIFKHLSVNEGLASNQVYCTIQDSKGMWWIGTDNGLQRWDGYRFVTYQSEPGNEHSLSNNTVLNLLLDTRKNIWIAHGNAVTVLSVSKNLFTRVPIDTLEYSIPFSETINSLFEDLNHTVWIAGSGIGLQYYDNVQERFVSYSTKLPPFPLTIQYACQQKSTGNYWFGTDLGLVCYDVKTRQYYYREYNPKGIAGFSKPSLQHPYTCFFLDRDERLWLSNWLDEQDEYAPSYYCYDLEKDTVVSFGKNFLGDVHSAAQDEYGRIWLSGDLVHYYEPAKHAFTQVKKQPGSKLGMDYDGAGIVQCDRDGNIWLNTDNGLYLFDPGIKAISTYEADPAATGEADPNFSVTGFLEYDRNNIWVTTWGRGVFLYDSAFKVKKRIFRSPDGKPLSLAWSVTRAANNHVWFGWQEGVLLEYDPATGQQTYRQPPELRNKTVRQLASDKNGNVWAGTQRGILAVFNTQTGVAKRIIDGEIDGSPIGHIMTLRADARQHLWAGTSHGGLLEINMQDGKLLRHFSRAKGSLAHSDVNDMCFLNDTTLILVSSAGIEILNTKTGRLSLFEYPALRTNNIKAIEKGKNNDIYLAGPTGIIRVNLPLMKLQVLDQQDGLLFTVFAEGAHITLHDGRICFGTNRNFITVNDRNPVQQKTPVALISNIRIMNQSLTVDSLIRFGNRVELTHDRNYVAIDFTAPSMVLEPNNTFLYKMEGFDKAWRIAAAHPTAEYSNLPPGKYRFMVKYRNTYGDESSEATVMPFIIHPPFWQTWWFITIAACALLSILFLLHRIRVNKLLTMEKVRRHIARDLHDDMGSTLSSINILSVMSSKTLEREPARTKEYLDRISDSSQRMMESMDDIVWSINPLNDSMQKIVARMREVAANILEPKDIEYSFFVDESVHRIRLEMSKRRDLFLIFKEAINNMAKYAECSKANIHVTAIKKRLIMHIEDNGCGFDETIIDDGNGLINMRKRAESLHGRLTIRSVVNEGTQLTLNIPVT